MTQAQEQARNLERYVAGGVTGEVWGIRWGDPEKAERLAFVLEQLRLAEKAGQQVIEIGYGGGRWTRYLAEKAVGLHLIDGTPAAETAMRSVTDLSKVNSVKCYVSPEGGMPWFKTASIDLVFSFDTFVYFHQELFQAYLAEVSRVLRRGGTFILHYARKYQGLTDALSAQSLYAHVEDRDIQILCDSNKFRVVLTQDFNVGGGSRLLVLCKK